MVKFKHNKKRNTGFLYEALILELTKAVLKKSDIPKDDIVSLIKEAFRPSSCLYKDLKLYQSLTKTKNVNPITAEKILAEVRSTKKTIDQKKLTQEQNELVRKARKMMGGDVLNNFVPNYKLLATISQIFNHKVPINSRVLLENQVLGQMTVTQAEAAKEKMAPIDNLVFQTFSKKFNEEYTDTLLSEQKTLLAKYASSFADNSLELKVYLNEEVGRLKKEIKESLSTQELLEDSEMHNKAKEVLGILESYKKRQPNKDMIRQIIKIQSLASELKTDG